MHARACAHAHARHTEAPHLGLEDLRLRKGAVSVCACARVSSVHGTYAWLRAGAARRRTGPPTFWPFSVLIVEGCEALARDCG